MKKTVQIYTDGACSGNPGPGGWGAVLRYGKTEKEISGGEADTTNNRMEMMAVILTAVLKKVKGLEEAETLWAEKEMNFRKRLKESKGKDLSDLLAEDPNPKEPEN